MAARRLAAAFAATLAVLAGLAAWQHERVLEKVLWLRYWRTLETPRLPPPRDAATSRREDLDFLARLPEVDRAFDDASRAEFARRMQALRSRADALDDTRFALGVAHAAAAAGNGHTQLEGDTWRARFASVPVRFAWFGEALHVARVRPDHAALLGAQVLDIAGVDPGRWLGLVAPYVSGTPERVRALSPHFIESPAVVAALRPGADAARLSLRVRDRDGREREVALDAVAPAAAPKATKPGRVLAAEPIDGEGGGWLTLDASRALVSLRGADSLFHAERSGDTLYLHPWRVSRGFDASVGRAIDHALGAEEEPRWRRIVLDLRFNDGGEYPMVYRALARLPDRLAAEGKLAILTDETTYSGAIIAAALARHFTGARAQVVGTRAGDSLAFWAEGTHVELPHSRLRVSIATGYHDWAHGCRAWRCYWPNILRGVAAGTIEPSMRVAWRFGDYARGIDTVLEAALR
jgi:hypothetical protein